MKSFFRSMSLAVVAALAMVAFSSCADATPQVLANPFKANVKAVQQAATNPPWTTGTNPSTTVSVYLSMPVFVEYSGSAATPAYIQVVTTPGWLGRTPMAEDSVFYYGGAMTDQVCQIFNSQHDAEAAYAYAVQNSIINFYCVGWPNNL